MNATAGPRAAILSGVRAALGVRADEASRLAAVEDRLKRHPRGTIPARALVERGTLLQSFETMLTDQGASVTHAATPEDAVRAIADDLRAHDLPLCLRLGDDAVLAALPWEAVAVERRFGPAQSDDRAALSRAITAAAETGTLFLVSGADNPTTLAFLPESHTILVGAGDIAGCYEEGFDRLRAIYGEGALPRTVNLISGPSRTADIEQTIVRGAHGPKRLHVVILG
ncbi:MAG: lactate utilization protein [Methyloceanibacter sp.]